eukprot:scaffold2312_cov165-Ochromonas_danica.AAC.12
MSIITIPGKQHLVVGPALPFRERMWYTMLSTFFSRCIVVAHKTCGHHSSTSLLYDHNASCEDDGWSACLAGESTEGCNPRGKGALLSPAHGLLLLIVPVSSASPIALILVVGLDEANDRLGADEDKT